MYNESYDNYMRGILGYTNLDDEYRNNAFYNMPNQDMYSSSDDLERMYPEVYRVVYPMVCSACDRIQFPNTTISEDMVTRMTDDIYDRVESDGRINIEVNVTTEVRESNDRQIPNETRQRRPRNRFLRDLIRILLLRELLRRRRRFPGRPPFPMRPF
ncbi:MAG: hypothetical protein IJE05_05315 [Clostridia bacterium]|nr:hypothetical protein [Clostridia bacterium]